MSTENTATTLTRPQIALSRVLLPTEHGSWAFLFEPLVAGLAICFSPAAPMIAIAAIAAFFARQPLKTYFLLPANSPVASTAIQFATLFGAVSMLAIIGAAWVGGTGILSVAGAAAIVGGMQFRLDIARAGRSLAAELAGSAAISSSVAMMALADGRTWGFAAAIWAIFAMRFLPSILYVRTRLLLEKGKSFKRDMPIFAHAASLVGITSLYFLGLASILTVAIFLFLLARCVVGLSERRTKMKAMKIGVWEVVYGSLTLLSIIVGYYAGI